MRHDVSALQGLYVLVSMLVAGLAMSPVVFRYRGITVVASLVSPVWAAVLGVLWPVSLPAMVWVWRRGRRS